MKNNDEPACASVKCEHCDYEGIPELMKRHQISHKDDRPWKCKICNESFNLKTNLTTHKFLHTTTNYCGVCKKTFQRKSALYGHVKLHLVDDTLECPKCDRRFVSAVGWSLHLTTCGKPPVTVEKWNNATRKVKTKYLKSGKCDSKNGKESRCLHCSKTFTRRYSMKRHMLIHTGEKPFKCSLCKKAFNQAISLQFHMVIHSGYKPFKCNVCLRRFTHKGNLQDHTRRVHSTDPAVVKYACEKCSCAFKKSSSLVRHLNVMHSLRDNAHDDVDGIFADSLQHLSKLSEMIQERANAQNSIDNNEKLISKESIKNLEHIQNHDSMSPPKMVTVNKVIAMDEDENGDLHKYYLDKVTLNDSVWYCCLYCAKKFKKKHDVVRHIRVHTKIRPYKCDQCSRTFTLKRTLTIHKLTHSNTKINQSNKVKKDQSVAIITEEIIPKNSSEKIILDESLMKNSVKFLIPNNFNQFIPIDAFVNFSTNTDARDKMTLQSSEGVTVNTFQVENNNQTDKHDGDNQIIFELHEITDTQDNFPKQIDREQTAKKSPQTTKSSSRGQKRVKKRKSRNKTCTLCFKTFQRPSDLERHLRIHNNEKPFACVQCKKMFRLKQALDYHMQTHENARVKTVKCTICGETFATNGTLKVHLRRHADLKPFLCRHCGQSFRTSGHQKTHEATHVRISKKEGVTPEETVVRYRKTQSLESYVNLVLKN